MSLDCFSHCVYPILTHGDALKSRKFNQVNLIGHPIFAGLKKIKAHLNVIPVSHGHFRLRSSPILIKIFNHNWLPPVAKTNEPITTKTLDPDRARSRSKCAVWHPCNMPPIHQRKMAPTFAIRKNETMKAVNRRHHLRVIGHRYQAHTGGILKWSL